MGGMKIAPEAPSRASYHHGDLRRALLEAALDLVSRRGAEAFSLREAARAVGVSPAAAYRHFQDKAALLYALALAGMARLGAAMGRAMARVPGIPGSPARAAGDLAALGEAYVEFAVRHPAQFRVMFGPWCEQVAPQDPAVRAGLGGPDPYQLLVDALDAMVRSGAMAPAARQGAEVAAWAAVHGLATLLVEGALELSPAERGQAVAVIQRTLLLGFGCAPGLLGPGAGVTGPDADPHRSHQRRRTPAAAGRKR